MNWSISKTLRYILVIVVGASIGMLYAFSAVQANAATSAQLSIANNGQAMIKGGIVIGVSGTEITAVTSWGDTKIKWRIITNGSTRFLPNVGSKAMLRAIKPGHELAFSGTIDMTAKIPTVYASVVKNESILQSAVMLDGTILDTSGGTLIIQTENGTSTVLVGTGTLMTLNGDRVDAEDMLAGDVVKVMGTLNTLKRELAAERITATSLEPRVEPQIAKLSIFSSLIAWFQSTQGSLSVR